MSVSTNYDYSVSTAQQREIESKNSSYGTSSTDFLQLLIVQLTNQDPLNPMEDMDFTSQLAQLQALEEQIAMTKSMNAMRIDTQIQSATAMIGKTVSGVDGDGEYVTGTVSRVVQTSEDVFVELLDGKRISVSSVIEITGADNGLSEGLASAANFIDMWVEAGHDSAGQAIQGIVETVGIEDGQVVLKLYGGKSVAVDRIEKMRAPTDNDLWYTLPDSVREKVEKAQTMLGLTVTGTGADGESVTGIVANAELDASNNVNLILFDGTRVNVDDVTGTPRQPTAEDAVRDLTGLWAVGLDEEGATVEGLITGAEDRGDGLVLLLDGGGHVYFDSLTEIAEAPTE